MDRLGQLLNNLELIQSTHAEDACIVLANTEKVIGYISGKTIDLKIPIGASVDNFKGTVTYNALITRKPQKEERGPESFGIAYISTATPIMENDEVIGVISTIVSNNKVDVLRQSAHKLTGVSEELATASEDVTKVTERIALELKDLNEETTLLRNEIKNIEEILGLLKKTSVRSRILGLNASIEAVRSGEHGKGFAVVAREIEKMAENNRETVEGVEPQLKGMIANLEKIITKIQHIAFDSLEQSVKMEEFNQSFEQIINTAAELSQQSHLV
ncbi:methyl-accepting chemotaxis protein [Neobacillus drentensis]|uniref:methyl-accepting chemotaxis protein n=1 Tax=Neobacillus drentensis TaxID=220684 RepID=UPI002FFFC474